MWSVSEQLTSRPAANPAHIFLLMTGILHIPPPLHKNPATPPKNSPLPPQMEIIRRVISSLFLHEIPHVIRSSVMLYPVQVSLYLTLWLTESEQASKLLQILPLKKCKTFPARYAFFYVRVVSMVCHKVLKTDFFLQNKKYSQSKKKNLLYIPAS